MRTQLKSWIIQNILNLSSEQSHDFWKNRHLSFDQNKWAQSYFDSEYEYRRAIVKMLEVLHVKNVFEFGCNSGPNAKLIQELPIKYVGVDVNENAVEMAKKNITKSGFEFYNTIQDSDIIDKLNYQTFDCFLSVYSMCYLELVQVEKFFKKMNNVNYIILAEPSNDKDKIIALNRIPEFSYDYEKIINILYPDLFYVMKIKLEKCNNNLKSIFIFVRKKK